MTKLLAIVLSFGFSCVANTLQAENQSPVQNEQSLFKQSAIKENPWIKAMHRCQAHIDKIEHDQTRIIIEIGRWKLSHNTPLTRRQSAELQHKLNRKGLFAKLKKLRTEQLEQLEMKYRQSLYD